MKTSSSWCTHFQQASLPSTASERNLFLALAFGWETHSDHSIYNRRCSECEESSQKPDSQKCITLEADCRDFYYPKCTWVLVIKIGRHREDMGHQILVPEAETIK